VLHSWYETNGHEIVPVTHAEANQYPDCCVTGYRPGKLVWHPGELKLYFITNDHPDPNFPNTPEYMLGRKILVPNPTVQYNCFKYMPYIVDPGGATLNLHGTGPTLSDCSTSGTHPNGTIVQSQSSGAIYILEEGKKRHLINPNAQSSWDIQLAEDIVSITGSEADLYVSGYNMAFQPGTLVQKSTSPYEVYFVTNEGDFLRGVKRHVANPTTLNCLFPNEYIRQASVSELNNHATGAPIQVATC
jgi:hypothetical protein